MKLNLSMSNEAYICFKRGVSRQYAQFWKQRIPSKLSLKRIKIYIQTNE